MKYARFVLLFMLGFASPAVVAKESPMASTKIADKIECLVLSQSSEYAGDQTIYVAPQAVRAFNRYHDTCIICKAPDWKVWIINQKRHLIYSSSLEKWQGGNVQGIAMYLGKGWEAFNWSMAGQKTYAGLSCKKFLQGGLKKGVATPLNPSSKGIYFACDNGKDPHVYRFLQKLHTVPPVGGIPMFLEFNVKANYLKAELETKSAKTQAVPRSSFDIPSDYKTVKNENDIYTDEKMQGLLQDMNN